MNSAKKAIGGMRAAMMIGAATATGATRVDVPARALAVAATTGPLWETVVRQTVVATVEAATISGAGRDRVTADGQAIRVLHRTGTRVPPAAPTAKACREARMP